MALGKRLGSRLGTRLGSRLGEVLPSGFDGLLGRFGGAVAAYSLREIGKVSKVVRVRSSAANNEEDFSASDLESEITTGELNLDPSFADNGTWSLAGGWSISGGALNLVSTAANDTATLPINESDANDYYLMRFTIDSCSDFSKVGLRVSSTVYREFSDMGITSAGTYEVIVDHANGSANENPRFHSFDSTTGVTCSISEFSIKGYSPSALELWMLSEVTYNKSIFTWGKYNQLIGRVRTWYDQSGNGNDATQAVASSQPRIVDFGKTVLGESGHPSVEFLWNGTTSDLLTADSLSVSQPSTHFAVADLDEDRTIGNVHTIASSSQTSGRQHIVNNSSNLWQAFAGTALSSASSDSGYHIHTALFNSTSSYYRQNGSELASGDAGSQDFAGRLRVGSQQGGSHHFDGKIQEFIFYPRDMTSDVDDIESDINGYYSAF